MLEMTYQQNRVSIPYRYTETKTNTLTSTFTKTLKRLLLKKIPLLVARFFDEISNIEFAARSVNGLRSESLHAPIQHSTHINNRSNGIFLFEGPLMNSKGNEQNG